MNAIDSIPFSREYASCYDVIYSDKSYEKECDLIDITFAKHALRPIHKILDMGCGTGGHALELAKRGYSVTGVDRSKDMMQRACTKRDELGASVEFVEGDLRYVWLDHTFDSVVMMFAVLSYQLDNASVVAALSNAGRHLSPGGLLLCDFWYGPATLNIKPTERMKTLQKGSTRVIRWASGRLNSSLHQCEVDFTTWRIEPNRTVVETRENHTMRYFFPLELELFCDVAGLTLLSLTSFPQIAIPATDSTWSAFLVAQKRPEHHGEPIGACT